jgi:hypothetical protein
VPREKPEPYAGPVEYVFSLHGGDYVWVTFADAPERDVEVSRGATMTEEDAARLSKGSQADLKRWLKGGEVIARPIGKES